MTVQSKGLSFIASHHARGQVRKGEAWNKSGGAAQPRHPAAGVEQFPIGAADAARFARRRTASIARPLSVASAIEAGSGTLLTRTLSM